MIQECDAFIIANQSEEKRDQCVLLWKRLFEISVSVMMQLYCSGRSICYANNKGVGDNAIVTDDTHVISEKNENCKKSKKGSKEGYEGGEEDG